MAETRRGVSAAKSAVVSASRRLKRPPTQVSYCVSDVHEKSDMSDLPIACTLALDERAARREELLAGLMRLSVERREMSAGFTYRFEASSETLQSIVRVIDAERQCCRFFRFQLTVEPADGPITLEVTGPEGTREFLRDLESDDAADHQV